MGFQQEVKRELGKAAAPQQWNGEQDCQVCGKKLGWHNGVSTCGHMRHTPSWEEQANGVLSDLARYQPGDTLSTGLLDRDDLLGTDDQADGRGGRLRRRGRPVGRRDRGEERAVERHRGNDTPDP